MFTNARAISFDFIRQKVPVAAEENLKLRKSPACAWKESQITHYYNRKVLKHLENQKKF